MQTNNDISNGNRYHVMSQAAADQHPMDLCCVCQTNDLALAVTSCLSDRETSHNTWIYDFKNRRQVTRGDVRRAGL